MSNTIIIQSCTKKKLANLVSLQMVCKQDAKYHMYLPLHNFHPIEVLHNLQKSCRGVFCTKETGSYWKISNPSIQSFINICWTALNLLQHVTLLGVLYKCSAADPNVARCIYLGEWSDHLSANPKGDTLLGWHHHKNLTQKKTRKNSWHFKLTCFSTYSQQMPHPTDQHQPTKSRFLDHSLLAHHPLGYPYVALLHALL